MSKNQVRRILNDYIPLVKERAAYQEELKKYQCMKSTDMNFGLPRKAIEREDIIMRKYSNLIERQTSLLNAILDLIYTLPDSRQRTIVHMRYVQGVPFAQIENELNISESTRKRELNVAIETMEKNIK